MWVAYSVWTYISVVPVIVLDLESGNLESGGLSVHHEGSCSPRNILHGCLTLQGHCCWGVLIEGVDFSFRALRIRFFKKLRFLDQNEQNPPNSNNSKQNKSDFENKQPIHPSFRSLMCNVHMRVSRCLFGSLGCYPYGYPARWQDTFPS